MPNLTIGEFHHRAVIPCRNFMNLELQATSPTLTSTVGEISFFLCRWAGGAWRRLILAEEAHGWTADEAGFRARLKLLPRDGGRWDFHLSFTADEPDRLDV